MVWYAYTFNLKMTKTHVLLICRKRMFFTVAKPENYFPVLTDSDFSVP